MPSKRHVEQVVPGLRVKYEPYADVYPEEKGLLQLLDDVRNSDVRLPHIMIIG